jgi:hypothetical protein
MLWIDPASIARGRLTDLALSSRRTIRPRGVLLSSYARLKLRLAIEGFDARFFAYDWRLGIDEIGAALAAPSPPPASPPCSSPTAWGPRRAHRDQAPAEAIGTPAHHAGSTEPRFPRARARAARYVPVRAEALAARPQAFAGLSGRGGVLGFPGLYHMLPPQRDSSSSVDLLDPSSWPSDGVAPRPELLASVAEARAGMAEPDARMVQIVGVNRQTVVSVRRTPAGFEYGSTPHGDGTVPLAMAQVPGLETFYVEESHGNLASSPRIIDAIVDLIRSGTTRGLSVPCAPNAGPGAAHRRCSAARVDTAKIDWRRLDSAQREAVMADLDGPEEASPGSAASLA